MNYIPGFSNYLETTVPAYAEGGAIMGDPQRAAVAPMTQEAAAPYDLSGLSPEALASLYALSSSDNFNQGNYGSDFGSLDNVYGMNFGSDFGGGLQGGSLYKVNPYLQSFAAPLSDKGNPTAYGGGNIEVKSPTQTFRLLDKNTGQVVYEGVGYEGAQEAINRANALTAEGGAKAQWQIQTPNSQQESGYSVVANEKRSQSTAGDIASFALPVALAVLTGGMSLPAQMAAAGIGGAMGAGLAGKNPAKAGLLNAATAGIMGGSGANAAIGKAVGNVGGALAAKTTEELTKTAAEKAAEQIIVTGLSKAAQGAGSAIGNTLLSQGVKGGLSEITGYKTPAEKFAEQPLPTTLQPPVDMYAGLDPIDVTALTRLTQGTGNALGNAALSEVVKGPLSDIASTDQPKPTEKTAEDIEAEKNPMVVTAPTTTPGTIPAVAGGVMAGLPALSNLPMDPALTQPETLPEDIVVNAPQSVLPAAPILGVETALPAITGGALTAAQTAGTPPAEKELGLKDYLEIGGDVAGLLGALAGGAAGGGSGQSGTYTPGGRGLNPIFSAKLPSAGGLGNYRHEPHSASDGRRRLADLRHAA
jgi:hypothetical protein